MRAVITLRSLIWVRTYMRMHTNSLDRPVSAQSERDMYKSSAENLYI